MVIAKHTLTTLSSMRPLWPAIAIVGSTLLTSAASATCESVFSKTQVVWDFFDFADSNSGGKIGPRALTFARQVGKVHTWPGERIWISRLPMDEDEVYVDLFKTAPSGAGLVVRVCKQKDRMDTPQRVIEEKLAKDLPADKGQPIRWKLQGVKGHRIWVHLDNPNTVEPFEYALRLQRPTQGEIRPHKREDLPAACGFADLHLHQTAHLAFGGGYLWGSFVGGSIEACSGMNHGLTLKVGALNHKAHTVPGRHWPSAELADHQQVSREDLKEAHENGLSLIVSVVENNQALCKVMKFLHSTTASGYCDDMDSAKVQIQAIHAFARKNPWYRIAHDPWEARRIIRDGDLAVVIGVEVSNLFPESQGRWEGQFTELYDMGVRQLELAHNSDTLFAGSAQQQEVLYAFLNWLKRAALSRFSPETFEKTRVDIDKPSGHNLIGLLPEGKELVDAMIRRGMLVSIDHISRRARKALRAYVAENHRYYPLIATHTRFDQLLDQDSKDHSQEYMLSAVDVDAVLETGGIIGMRTGPNKLRQVAGCVQLKCGGSTESLAQLVCAGQEAGVAMALGTDLNGGPFGMTGPRFESDHVKLRDGTRAACPGGGTPASDAAPGVDSPAERATGHGFDVEGLAHVGYEDDLIADLRILGAPTQAVQLHRSAESFLRVWERAFDPNRNRLSRSAYAAWMGLDEAGPLTGIPSQSGKDPKSGKCPR